MRLGTHISSHISQHKTYRTKMELTEYEMTEIKLIENEINIVEVKQFDKLITRIQKLNVYWKNLNKNDPKQMHKIKINLKLALLKEFLMILPTKQRKVSQLHPPLFIALL